LRPAPAGQVGSPLPRLRRYWTCQICARTGLAPTYGARSHCTRTARFATGEAGAWAACLAGMAACFLRRDPALLACLKWMITGMRRRAQAGRLRSAGPESRV
jgi:hypothetical protein